MTASQMTLDAAKRASNYLLVRTAAVRGQKGKDWYAHARTALDLLIERKGYHRETFYIVMGATSPQVKVWMNIRHTIRVMEALKANNGNIEISVASVPGLMGSVRKATIKALIAGDTSTLGPKTRCFTENLLGNENVVTLDTWMGQFVGLPSDKSGRVTTKAISVPYTDTIQKIANNLNWTPAMVQAAVWTYASAQIGNRGDGSGDINSDIHKALMTA